MPKMTYIIELAMDNFNNLPVQREEIAVSDRNVAITVAKALKKSALKLMVDSLLVMKFLIWTCLIKV